MKTVNAVVEMLISKMNDRIFNTASVIHISKKDNLQKNTSALKIDSNFKILKEHS